MTERHQLLETITTYQQMVATVTNYCSAIIMLPDIKLNNPADWYDSQFIQNYSKARSHPRCWTDNGGILDQLNQIPANIVQYDFMFQGMKLQIISFAELIIESPASQMAQQAKKQLAQYLSTLQQTVKGYQLQVSGVCQEITDFKKAVIQYKDFFVQLYESSKDTKKADDQLIKEFNARIDELNKDIEKWNNVKIAMLASVGVTALVSIVSFAFGPIGILVGIICGVELVAEGITELVADEKVKADNEQLNIVTSKFNSYTQDASCLASLINQLNTLTGMLDETVKAISGIDLEWRQLDTNIDILFQHLNQAEAERETEFYEALIFTMKESGEEWSIIVDAAQKLQEIDETIDMEHVYPVKFA